MTSRSAASVLSDAIRKANPTLSVGTVLKRMANICTEWPIREWGACFGCSKANAYGPLCASCDTEFALQTIAAEGEAISDYSIPPAEPAEAREVHLWGHFCPRQQQERSRPLGSVSSQNMPDVTCPECRNKINEFERAGIRFSFGNAPGQEAKTLEERVTSLEAQVAALNRQTPIKFR
jgi:hypothetical protein